MKIKFFKPVLVVSIVTCLFMFSSGVVFSQNSTKCRLVESLGNNQRIKILNQINASVVGAEYKISKRKKLIIKKVKSIHFKGCKAIVVADVKLKRKIRRDANGVIRITAVVDACTRREVCLKNSKIDKVRLSNTLRIGEAMYKWIANKVLPNNVCYAL